MTTNARFVIVAALVSGCAFEVDNTTVDGQAPALDEKSIVGGSPASIADHPWQVSIQTTWGEHFCGGSILSDTWILTAQHCVDGATASSLRVVAGSTRLSQPGQARSVAEIVRFSGYTSPENGKDVSLLRLSSPLSLNTNVQAINIATSNDESAGVTAAGILANVSGWGTLSSNGSSPDDLRAVNVPLVSNATAQQRYPSENITSDQLAAGGDGRDSCQGDSGGPLTVSTTTGPVLIGVVSWGYGCGDARYPGLYARVSSFASWIGTTTGISSSSPVQQTTTTETLFDQALDGAQGSFQHFTVSVPAGAVALDVVLSGNNGDADLYVRRGQQPTANEYDCRPYTNGTNENCSIANPASGTWYVSVHGYSAYTSARLVVTARVSGETNETGVIASDDFSSSTWSGGVGFASAWTRSGEAVIASGGARLRTSTGDIRRSVNVDGNVTLTFRARVQSFESGDEAYVKVKLNDGAWTTIHTFDSGDSDDAFHTYSLDLGNVSGTLQVRFDAQMSSASDALFVDDIVLL
jgi:secreted trypsin-like serine protease